MVLTKWELADWEFISDAVDEKIDSNGFAESLVFCESVIAILLRYQLLHVSKVCVLDNRYAMQLNTNDELHRKEQEKALYIESRSVMDITASIRQCIDSEQTDDDYYYPNHWIYYGSSTLFNAEGETYDMDDAIYVDAYLMPGHFSLSVETRTDVWLPHTIGGEPQPEICRLNAPRLEAALEAIDRETALTFNDPEEVFSSRYCDINGFKLENTYYFDGEICRFNKRGQSILSPEDEDQ